MARTSKSPRSLRALRSSFAPLRDEQVMLEKPVVLTSRPTALRSPFQRKTIKEFCLSRVSLTNDPQNDDVLNETYCSMSSDDTSALAIGELSHPIDPLEITQAHCHKSLTSTTRGVFLRRFLERSRETELHCPATASTASITPSKISSTAIRGPANLPLIPDLSIPVSEIRSKEVNNTLPKVTIKPRRHCGPAFAQLRCSEGEAHVDYVRLHIPQKGGSETSPSPKKLTRSPPFVGLPSIQTVHNGVVNSAA